MTERESRKVVTALFSDVVGSTNLGESHDPETFRRVLGRYFEEARAVVEGHGGSVEKFIGDAVVALFGVPAAREDDALRALRAADELRTRLDSLNDTLEQTHGIRIAVRTGVNTGEVIVAETSLDGFRASGDTMNVAARLEQSARAGEILIGSLTRELGGQAIEVEAVEPLELKGKADPVPAFRLVRVLPDTEAYERSGDSPLVGRTGELELLRGALRRARDGSRCVTCTVVGPAGVGKSRLVREFLGELDDETRVLIGRCRAYGEGVTFLPLAEALEPVLGDDPRAAVLALLGDEERAESIANDVHALVRADDDGSSTDDASWAIRRVLEALGRERPLVLLVDDIHWAEPSLLDLVEYVSSFSTDAPLLLLANARPDLLEEHPTWATPRENATVIVLQPLSEGESAELAAHLAPSQLDAGRIRTLVDAADGNPLFLEQLVALNADSPAELLVPPTIHALLAARIDRLELRERQVLECAAVEGREFRRQSLVELLPESARDAIDAHLLSLARRQYIRAARHSGSDDAFVFVHALMRDAAYQSISKERRADLHVRLAEHLETHDRAAGEVVGHHLAQAYWYRRELEGEDDSTRALALRAAELLAGGGERAFARGDDRAAARLLEQACDLVPIDLPLGRQVRIELGRALAGTGSLERAEQVFQALRVAAGEAGDIGLERRAELGLLSLRAQTDAHLSQAELISTAEEALPVFEERGDERGLARAWFLIHWAKFRLGRCEESIHAAERVIEHSARAGDTREQLRALGAIAMATFFGATPVLEGLRRADELLERAGGARLVEAFVLRNRASLLAMTGEFDEARELCRRSVEIYEELGHPISAIGVVMEVQRIEVQAGRLDVAESGLRGAHQRLRDLTDVGYLSWVVAALSRVLALRGEYDEALELARVAREELQRDLAYGQITARLAEAQVLVARALLPEAEERAGEALERVRQTDLIWLHGDTLVSLAEIDRAAGRDDLARQRIEEALGLYEQKGDVISAARVRARFEPA